MKQQIDPQLQQKEYISDATAISKLRKLKQITQAEAGLLLNCSISTIKRREHKDCNLTVDEIDNFLKAYGYTRSDLINIKLSRPVTVRNHKLQKTKIIEHKSLRRSYKKIITKEVLALIELRKRAGTSIKDACEKCNYNRSTIGAIENGRITLTEKRIKHIVASYGFRMKDFNSILKSDLDRLGIIDECFQKLRRLTDEKLSIVVNLLKTI